MKSSRRLLGCVALGLLALSCTDRKERLQAERNRKRAEQKLPYVPPRAGPTNPGVSARARATVAARKEAADTGKLLTILFSSNLDGEYDAQPLGGLARRATLVAKTRAAPGSVLHVDAGDSLLPRIPATGEPPPDPKEVDRRAKLMATGLGRLTLDAVTPGENELAMGIAKLKSLAKSARLPMISSNLKDARGKLLFEPYKIIQTKELKIGVFGVTTLAVGDAEKLRPLGITAADAVGAAQGSISALREKQAQVVIGLFHVSGGLSEARQLTRQLTGLDAMVLGHQGRRLKQRTRVNREDRYMLEAQRRGRMIGKMEMRIGEKAIAFKGDFAHLDSSFVSDPKIEALVKPYILESQRRTERKLPVGVSGRAGSRGELATADQEKWTYASTTACASCHPKASEHFASTPHASALATLERKGRLRDPECLLCHSTGFDRPCGTHNLATAAEFYGNVGCESCHGPSATHVRSKDKTGTSAAVAEAVCKECHTPEQTVEPFNYATAIRQVLGKGHGENATLPPLPDAGTAPDR